MAGYQLSFGRLSLFYSVIVDSSFIFIPDGVGFHQRMWPAHKQDKVLLLCLRRKSGVPHAAVCGRCAVPRRLDRSQPLLWPTFSVWCLWLFINPWSVIVAQKPETAVEGLGALREEEEGAWGGDGDGMTC